MAKGTPKRGGGTETPLMQQYNALKAKHPDTILLFRVGDFYETFGPDAIRTAELLGITLTRRANGAASEVELAGFPHHALDTYLPRLVRGGARVAVCDQLEDPKLAKGLVRRGITEIVTPGLAFTDSLLEPAQANYLVGLVLAPERRYGLAALEASTGEVWCTEGPTDRLDALLAPLRPAEIVIRRGDLRAVRELLGEAPNLYRLEDWVFEPAYAEEQVLRQFSLASLKGLGVDGLALGAAAAGALVHYLKENEQHRLGHLRPLAPFDTGQYLALDRFTLRNLEVLAPQHPEGRALVQVLDHTRTAMGARLLRRWLAFPLRDRSAIEARHDCLAALLAAPEALDRLRTLLGQVADLERLAMRLATLRLNPREAATLRTSLERLPGILEAVPQPGFTAWRGQVPRAEGLLAPLVRQLTEAPPPDVAKGGVIAAGVSAALDETRALKTDAEGYLARLRDQEAARTGIASLKIQYNRVFGYYIEVTHANAGRVPEDYIRKQTLANAERYITPELKVFEEKMLSAEETLLRLESELYQALLAELQPEVSTLQQLANALAELDVYCALATQAQRYHYVRPTFVEGPAAVLEIEQGRHPVIETLLPREAPYVPNDVTLSGDGQQILLITGPNMAGKSALLRQTALLVLLAQVGSYVPAQALRLRVVDKVFSRVGASDNLAAGESTFMVEMTETARILNQVTAHSLVLFDEIGRGTATYDGVAIAWALVEYLHAEPSRAALTLFATHYHELAELAEQLPRVKNYTVRVKEVSGKIIFLRTLVPGSAAHSFGIQVAEMAGVPPAVTARATELLRHFEATHGEALKGSRGATSTPRVANVRQMPPPAQLQLFSLHDPVALAVRELLEGLDVNTLTPIEALLKLQEIQRLVSGPR